MPTKYKIIHKPIHPFEWMDGFKDECRDRLIQYTNMYYYFITRKKKSAVKSPNISNFFRQRSGYISDFTLINPEKNLADFRGFNSTNPLSF